MNPDESGLPPVEGNPQASSTPPIVHETVPQVVPPRAAKEVEITRIPSPVVAGDQVVYPKAYGVDYTVEEKVVTGKHKLEGPLKVKAVARSGYRFAKGLTQTFNLNS